LLKETTLGIYYENADDDNGNCDVDGVGVAVKCPDITSVHL